jgi:hypothetical protein
MAVDEFEIILEHDKLTDLIRSQHEEPKFYHFTNEMNIFTVPIFGKNYGDVRKHLGLKPEQSFKDALSGEPAALEVLEWLQDEDVRLIGLGYSYAERKATISKKFEANSKK